LASVVAMSGGTPISEQIDAIVAEPGGWRSAMLARLRDVITMADSSVAEDVNVGSTSVPGLAAKPVIDIDLTVADPDREHDYVPALERIGFRLVIRQPWWYGHRALVTDEPRCNLHVFGFDSPEPLRHRLVSRIRAFTSHRSGGRLNTGFVVISGSLRNRRLPSGRILSEYSPEHECSDDAAGPAGAGAEPRL
jgi:GrpB-like predicted nucleotidyltransferase (UPF0157 family)